MSSRLVSQEARVGWLIVNVLIPVLLPPALLLVAKTAPVAKRLRLMDTLKDGQLCWFTITLSCATLYDLLLNEASRQRVAWCTFAIIWMALFGLLSAVLAVAAALEPTPLLDESVRWGSTGWRQHYSVFVVSAALAILASLGSLVAHWGLPIAPNP
jgi:hypothetical protein